MQPRTHPQHLHRRRRHLFHPNPQHPLLHLARPLVAGRARRIAQHPRTSSIRPIARRVGRPKDCDYRPLQRSRQVQRPGVAPHHYRRPPRQRDQLPHRAGQRARKPLAVQSFSIPATYGYDCAVLKLSGTNGNVVWGQLIPQDTDYDETYLYGLAVDGAGNLYGVGEVYCYNALSFGPSTIPADTYDCLLVDMSTSTGSFLKAASFGTADSEALGCCG